MYSCKNQQNGVEGSESAENNVVEKRKKKHMRSFSHTNRLSYLEAVKLLMVLADSLDTETVVY